MQVYWGSIDYFATGEGRTVWHYIGIAESKEKFKQQMAKELDINTYYLAGLVVGSEITEKTPLQIFEHWSVLTNFVDGKRICYGTFKYHMHYNFS